MRSGPLRRGLQALPSRSCPLHPELCGPSLSPASRLCGPFASAFTLFGARRREATTRAIASCGPNGATKRARGFSGFFRCRRRRALVLALSIAAAAHRPDIGLDLRDALGVVLFAVAALGERTADRQLARFGEDPRNKSKICDAGLWGYSRHPNYFFEWLVWVSFAIIAIAPVGHYPWGWFGLAAPVLMYVLLVHVSGIPPLEAHMLRSRGDAFRLYQARVNAFWPGPPRSTAEALRSGAPS